MANEIAVVLISGGMDSALSAGIAIDMRFDIAALHLNYGQKTQMRELKSYTDICDFYNIEQRLIVDVNHLSAIGGSSLTSPDIEVDKANLNNNEIPSSYVPFRNANILSIAVSWAEVIGAKAIFIGAMQLDNSGYPDCRREFFDAFEKTIELGTKAGTSIKIFTPLINMTKKEIVVMGDDIGVPFHLTWSCYSDSEIACGVCDSCALRLRGFQQAGISDPLEYKQIPDYLNF
ncbi:MAG: 7-cyano-7-deazaguanine synthase QueC [Bacteroidota bacterium]